MSTSSNILILLCLLYTHSKNEFLDDFLKISEHLTKIYEDSPKVVRRSDISFPNISEILKTSVMFRSFRNTST